MKVHHFFLFLFSLAAFSCSFSTNPQKDSTITTPRGKVLSISEVEQLESIGEAFKDHIESSLSYRGIDSHDSNTEDALIVSQMIRTLEENFGDDSAEYYGVEENSETLQVTITNSRIIKPSISMGPVTGFYEAEIELKSRLWWGPWWVYVEIYDIKVVCWPSDLSKYESAATLYCYSGSYTYTDDVTSKSLSDDWTWEISATQEDLAAHMGLPVHDIQVVMDYAIMKANMCTFRVVGNTKYGFFPTIKNAVLLVSFTHPWFPLPGNTLNGRFVKR